MSEDWVSYCCVYFLTIALLITHPCLYNISPFILLAFSLVPVVLFCSYGWSVAWCLLLHGRLLLCIKCRVVGARMYIGYTTLEYVISKVCYRSFAVYVGDVYSIVAGC